jgi:hypothetical protein
MRYSPLLGLLALAACQMESTSTCSQVPAVVGNWHYSSVEETPVHASVTGTLSITSASCSSIVGQMDVVQTDANGATQRLAGPVTGQVVDGSSFQFDAFLEATPRQHLASIHGDSLSGSWVSTAGTQSATGTFGGKRQ